MEDYAGYYYYFNRKSITGGMNYEKKHEEIMAELFRRFMSQNDLSLVSQEKRWVLEYAYLSNMINALVTFSHGCKVGRMRKKYDFFKKDLQEKFPQYKQNPYVGILKPKGQTLKIRLGVGVTMALHKVGLDKFLFYLISLV
jgi:hypothetical protein